MSDGPAPTLPQGRGYRPSIWADLDPTARLLLVNDILAANADWHLDGSVDPNRSLEPLFSDDQGQFWSIAGERIEAPSTGLVVDITAGQVAGGTAGFVLLLGAAVLALAFFASR